MISAKFLWGNVFFGGKLQIDAKNSNFEIFESALYLKSVSMPLRNISILRLQSAEKILGHFSGFKGILFPPCATI